MSRLEQEYSKLTDSVTFVGKVMNLSNLSNLASNIIMPLRPKEWYVVVLPGPFFESSKDAKCLKESN